MAVEFSCPISLNQASIHNYVISVLTRAVFQSVSLAADLKTICMLTKMQISKTSIIALEIYIFNKFQENSPFRLLSFRNT